MRQLKQWLQIVASPLWPSSWAKLLACQNMWSAHPLNHTLWGQYFRSALIMQRLDIKTNEFSLQPCNWNHVHFEPLRQLEKWSEQTLKSKTFIPTCDLEFRLIQLDQGLYQKFQRLVFWLKFPRRYEVVQYHCSEFKHK